MQDKLYCYVVSVRDGQAALLTRTSFTDALYDVPNRKTRNGMTLKDDVLRIILEQTGISIQGSDVIELEGMSGSQSSTRCFLVETKSYPGDRFSHTVVAEDGSRTEYHYRWVMLSEALESMLVAPAAQAMPALRLKYVQTPQTDPTNSHHTTIKSRVYTGLVRAWGNWHIPDWLRNLITRVVEPKYLAGVVGIVFDDQERVLLVRHTYRKDFPWAPPSGWMKRGEDPTQALEREIYEETGYRVWVGGAIAVGGDQTVRRLDLYYRCALLGGDFRPCAEVSAAGMFAVDDLPDAVEPFHREVIAYAVKRSGAAIPPGADVVR